MTFCQADLTTYKYVAICGHLIAIALVSVRIEWLNSFDGYPALLSGRCIISAARLTSSRFIWSGSSQGFRNFPPLCFFSGTTTT